MCGVQQCIFSSTGKAARYFTTEVYAASKKISEWQFAQAAQKGDVTYGMVRFTHMLENSSVCQQIDNKIQQGKIVNVHAPHRYVTAQNVSEASHLLLNALVLCQPGKLKFLTVRNLDWPVETLEVALYKIAQSGKDIPIYFQGLIPGYEEPCFLGQFDWDSPTEINFLTNALEPHFIDSSGELFVAEVSPFCSHTLTKHLAGLQILLADSDLPEAQIKRSLGNAVKEIGNSIFSQALTHTLLKILKWGANPKHFEVEEISIKEYRDVLELILQELYGRIDQEVLMRSQLTPNEVDDLIEILSLLPSVQQEVAYLRAVSRIFREFNLGQNPVEPFPDNIDLSNVSGVSIA